MREPDDGEESLSACVERQAASDGARVALGAGVWRPTYRELNGAANELARVMLARGGARGDCVALLMRHDTPLIAAVLAVLKIGRTVVVLNPGDPVGRLEGVLEDAEPALLLADSAHATLATAIAGRTRATICVETPPAGGLAANPGVAVSPDDMAFLVYTSGSAGRPKGVIQTHRSIRHHALRLARGLRLRADDRIVLLAALSSAQGVGTTWCALLTGASLCPFPTMEKGVTGLGDWIVQQGITVYVSAASVFRHFTRTLDPGTVFPGVRLVRLASEPATSDDFAAYQRHFTDDCAFFHTLSSSESGNVTQLRLTRQDRVAAGRLPVGRPVDGIQVRLVGEDGHDVPPGETGEIIVRSRSLSPGYWRNDPLTVERFSGPAGGGQARVFRSGDLGRFTADGLLEFVGRRDTRVKIRGHRVEVSEVETALLQQPAVEVAAVVVSARQPGNTELVAFITLRSGHAGTAKTLRDDLRAVLPGPMVPGRLVVLDSLPLGSQGKIDREKLRQMAGTPLTRPSGERPLTDTEVLLAGIWAEVLGRETVGRGDDFFDLGGDSLMATVIAAQVHAALGVELDLRAFAHHPGLADLAGVIDAARRAGAVDSAPSLARLPREGSTPLSFAQERTCMYSRSTDESAGYTVAWSWRIRGRLDVAALRESLDYIVRRHEVLRTTFAVVHGRPVQIVHPPAAVHLPILDLAAAPDAEARAALLLRDAARQPFDLTRGPLMRLRLVRIRDDEHWMLRVTHHIIEDGWSFRVFFRELGLLYEAKLRGEPPPLADVAPLQYGDYATWQRRVLRPDAPAHRDAVAWWKATLAGARPLDLPFRRPKRARGVDPAAGLIWWGLDPAVSRRLDEVGREEGATRYVVRLAAFAVFLAAATGQPDVVLGTYVTNRTRAELQNMLGFFVNLVTLRLRCDQTRTFRAWLAEVRDVVAATQARGEMPYEELRAALGRQGATLPEIRVIFADHTFTEAVRFGGLELTWLERRMERMPWGFSLAFNQHNEQHLCRLDFDAGVYEPAGVRDFLDRFLKFLAATSRHPDRPLAGVPGMDDTPLPTRRR